MHFGCGRKVGGGKGGRRREEGGGVEREGVRGRAKLKPNNIE